MNFSCDSCLECGHSRSDHPLIVLTNGHPTWDSYNRDGVIESSSDDGTTLIMFGQRWKVGFACSEFVEWRQLELF